MVQDYILVSHSATAEVDLHNQADKLLDNIEIESKKPCAHR